MITKKQVAKMIDHSLLHPTMTDEDVVKGCILARKLEVATVCVKPYTIETACGVLKSSNVAVGTVIGFPHGNSTLPVKVYETQDALRQGAREIDMVVNIGKVKSGQWEYVSREIQAINDTALAHDAILKVIFENDFLEDTQIIQLCQICSEHRVAFVKTSTGYGFVKQSDENYHYNGTTDHHLQLMRKHCAPEVQIKAAGGIRTLDDLLRVKELGVTRIGASATEAILDEAKSRGQ